MYDYLIIGSGFFGSICAYELNKKGYKVCVIDNRNHIGGNCYTSNRDGINVHDYGPHIFHTSNEEVWKWINQFVKFNHFRLSPVANYKGELYSLPFNMWTFSQMWGVTTPDEAKTMIQKQSDDVTEPTNLEEQAIKFVGKDVYNKLIKGYTEKQWRKPCDQLPKEIIKRLPVRFTYDNNYFNDSTIFTKSVFSNLFIQVSKIFLYSCLFFLFMLFPSSRFGDGFDIYLRCPSLARKAKSSSPKTFTRTGEPSGSGS